MENFIGNNAKFIIEWGQAITVIIIILTFIFIFKLVRNNSYFLPKGFIGYSFTIIMLLVIFINVMAFSKVTTMKPRISKVISELEYLLNKTAPDFKFTLLDNDSIKSISDYKGKLILLNFWATWCAPCLSEMPDLNKLHNNYKNDGLVVIALSDESKETLNKFAQSKPFTAIAAYSKEFIWANIQSERPMSFLIDKNGVIVEYFTGGYEYAFFEDKIKIYLE